MRGICPTCEKERDLIAVNAQEDIKVRGESIPVEVAFLRCSVCGEEFDDPKSPHDPLEIAYEEYRRRHALLRPEVIREFRSRFGLTQQELTGLLGWGGATLSRYENGALQDEAHDKMLKLAMEPRNLLALILENRSNLGENKRKRLIETLERAIEERRFSLLVICEDRFGSYEASILSGYQRLDLGKLFNALLFFCASDAVYKTKLNKLLFYADFKHFKEYAVSITGARYVHLPFGPVPDNYDFYFATLHHDEQAVEIKETRVRDYVGEEFVATRKPDVTVFGPTELKILASVQEYFQGCSATAISERAHKEKGYLDTNAGQYITYSFADSLSF